MKSIPVEERENVICISTAHKRKLSNDTLEVYNHSMKNEREDSNSKYDSCRNRVPPCRRAIGLFDRGKA